MTAITGHRGARNLWPENSLSGFRNALALGCDAIEFDVHLTDAGELVVIHDATLDRTTDASGEVHALTPQARGGTRLKDSDEIVPTLEGVLDVLAPAGGLHLYVEIKLDAHGRAYLGIAARVADLLTARGLGAPTPGLFRPRRAGGLPRPRPRIRRLVSADRAWVNRRGGLPTFVKEVADLVDIVALRHDFHEENWTEVCRLWQRERLCAWTVNEPGEMRRWLDRGVGHLTSDLPTSLSRPGTTCPRECRHASSLRHYGVLIDSEPIAARVRRSLPRQGSSGNSDGGKSLLTRVEDTAPARLRRLHRRARSNEDACSATWP